MSSPETPTIPVSRVRLSVLYAGMTVLGCAAGLALIRFLQPYPRMGGTLKDVMPLGILFGAPVGLAQWGVLSRHAKRVLDASGIARTVSGRRLVRETAWWVIATLAGSAAGWMLVAAQVHVLSFPRFSLRSIGLSGLLLGAAVGLAQGMLLRRRFPHAGRWILWSVAGMAAGHVLAHPFGPGYSDAFLDHLAYNVAFGIPVGAAQAFSLYRVEPAWRARILALGCEGAAATDST